MGYSMAQMTATGRVGRDPEKRTDKSPVEFNIAVDQGWGDKKQTNWITVKVWGKDGDFAMQAVSKGDLVTAAGKFEIRNYVGKDGAAKYALELIASDIVFASKMRDDKPAATAAGYDAGGDIPF